MDESELRGMWRPTGGKRGRNTLERSGPGQGARDKGQGIRDGFRRD